MVSKAQNKYHPEYNTRFTIEPTMMFIVKIDGFTKFQSPDYRTAIEYVMAARAVYDKPYRRGVTRVQMTEQRYEPKR